MKKITNGEISGGNQSGILYSSSENIKAGTYVIPSDTLCSCGPCKPAPVQRLATPLIFTAHAGLFLAVFVCAQVYFTGILTTIERRFKLSTSEVGALTVMIDASSLSLILFVTYFGHRSHRPRWVACGGIIIGIGLIICSLPHYLSAPIDTQSLIAGGTSTASQKSPGEALQLSGVCDHTSASTSNRSHTIGKCQQESSSGIGSVTWIIVGQLIMGCGSAPLFPLILSYIDDAVEKHKLTSYTAVFFVAITIGPIMGYFLATAATSRYVDFDRIPADQIPDIPQHDPRWIGAWWLGFPILGLLLMVFAVPMFFYPKVMRSQPTDSSGAASNDLENMTADTVSPTTQTGLFENGLAGILKSIKCVLLAVRRLVSNAALMFLCLGASSETALNIISGTFIVKYLQTQFGTSPAKAAFLSGSIIVPSVTVAQVVSAIICRRFKFNAKQCVRFVIGCHCVAFFAIAAQVFIGCTGLSVAGVNTPYSANDANTNSVLQFPPMMKSTQRPMLELESACNTKCSCPEEIFRPVCGVDSVSYISPCHAGCTQFNSSELNKYSHCACIFGRNSSSGGEADDNTATRGLCRDKCNSNVKLIMYITFSAIAWFSTGLTFNPLVFTTFRLVDAGDKSVAIGFKNLITKCLGFFPTPIAMGVIINSTCILWQYTCGVRGSCWLYDTTLYRYLFTGIPVGLKALSIISYLAVLFVMKSELKEEKDGIEHVEQGNAMEMDTKLVVSQTGNMKEMDAKPADS